MKNFKLALALLMLLGSTGMASAAEILVGGPGPQIAASVTFPGFRLVVGKPGYYCFYQGHYYSRIAWDRFCSLRRDRYAYRFHRDHDRRFDNYSHRD